ncbi:MAG TPA: SRPBCC family protein [Myxococcota bacterium]|nr:SRPBCC family protein [Myxococcota bacterium]
MASIHREARIQAPAETAWAALRDVGAIHRRLAPGFVVDTQLEDGARIVSFGNGMVVRELLVDVDEQARRVAWSARSERLTHHNASAQVFPDGPGRCRFVWIADLLPDEAAPALAAMIDQGMRAIRDTLERAEREAAGAARARASG